MKLATKVACAFVMFASLMAVALNAQKVDTVYVRRVDTVFVIVPRPMMGYIHYSPNRISSRMYYPKRLDLMRPYKRPVGEQPRDPMMPRPGHRNRPAPTIQ
jgi:hypothetical protein